VCVRVCACQLAPSSQSTMADTARDPPPELSDFQEVQDGEDLFPEPSATLEVRGGGGGGGEGGEGGEGGRRGAVADRA